jgi:transcriptional regulator of acetoin/glycerol metabolism
MKQSTGSDTQHAVKVSATPDFKLSRAKRAMDKTALLQCIEEQHWNMSRVAQVLGVSRNTLYRKLHKLQIDFKQEP